MPSPLVNLLLVAIAAAAQISVSPGTGRVVGRIVDAATGNPIAGVSVSLQGPRLADGAMAADSSFTSAARPSDRAATST